MPSSGVSKDSNSVLICIKVSLKNGNSMFLIPACFFFFPPLKIFLNKQPNPRKKLLVPCALDPPNTNCYVCASKPEVTVRLNVHKVTVLTLQDKASARTASLFLLAVSPGWDLPRTVLAVGWIKPLLWVASQSNPRQPLPVFLGRVSYLERNRSVLISRRQGSPGF
jgi:hypothetical protein